MLAVRPEPGSDGLHYRFYGHCLHSDYPFRTPLLSCSALPNVRFVVRYSGAEGNRCQEKESLAPGVYLRDEEGREVIHYPGLFDFILAEPDLIECRVQFPETQANEIQARIERALFGTVAAYWLESRGWLALHAAAVAVENQGIAFLADNQSGKTTLALGFLQAGYPLVTDNLLAIERSFVPERSDSASVTSASVTSASVSPASVSPASVKPTSGQSISGNPTFWCHGGPPHVRLWPEHGRRMFPDLGVEQRTEPDLEKWILPLGSWSVSGPEFTEGSPGFFSTESLTGESLTGESLSGESLSRGALSTMSRSTGFLSPASRPNVTGAAGSTRGLKIGHLIQNPVPLTQIFLPNRQVTHDRVNIHRLGLRDALRELQAKSFNPELNEGSPWRCERFQTLAQLLQQVPVYRLEYPDGLEALPQVRSAILQHLRAQAVGENSSKMFEK